MVFNEAISEYLIDGLSETLAPYLPLLLVDLPERKRLRDNARSGSPVFLPSQSHAHHHSQPSIQRHHVLQAKRLSRPPSAPPNLFCAKAISRVCLLDGQLWPPCPEESQRHQCEAR